MSEKERFEWDDTIENDGQEFILLPEGDYAFTVVDFERAWQQSTAKIPNGCNKAVLTLEVETPKGPARVTTNLLLLKLYLASGMPVIIWKEAALADYIIRNGCGIAVDSIEEIPSRVKEITPEEYETIRANTMKIAARLRGGRYTVRALGKVIEREE